LNTKSKNVLMDADGDVVGLREIVGGRAKL
jgi:hypothetical protein